jgi:uncharacterized membrane protein
MMKILGHPVHMMLIHFPSALFPMECVFYGLLCFTGKSSFAEASYYSLLGGTIMGWFALIFGTWDLVKIPSEKTEALVKGIIHGSINTTVLIAYTVFAYSLFRKYPDLPDASFILLAIRILLVLVLIVGNYIGASLILKYKIGIENKHE